MLTNPFEICYDGKTKEGILGRSNHQLLVKDMNKMNFKNLWQLCIERDIFDTKSLNRDQKHLILAILKSLIYHLHEDGKNYGHLFVDGELDFRLLMDEWANIEDNFISYLYHFLDEKVFVLISQHSVYSRTNLEQCVNDFNEASQNVWKKFSKYDMKQEQEEPFASHQTEDVSDKFTEIYVKCLDLIENYGIFGHFDTKRMILLRCKMFKQKTQKYWLVFLLMMTTYLKLSDISTNPWYDNLLICLKDDFDIKEGCKQFTEDISSWITDKRQEDYEQYVIKKAQEYTSYFTNSDWVSIETEIDGLTSKLGFLYGIQNISFDYHWKIKSFLEMQIKNKLVFKIGDLREIYKKIFTESQPQTKNRNELIGDITKYNPHCMKYSLTNEMIYEYDIDEIIILQSGLVLESETLIDIVHFSQGDNETHYVDFENYDGRIWRDEHDLYEILKFLLSKSESNKEYMKELLSEDQYALLLSKQQKDTFTEEENVFLNFFDMLKEQVKTNIIQIYKTYTERYISIIYVIDLIGKNTVDYKAIYESQLSIILKDMNILHLIGYFGYILASDKMAQHNEELSFYKISASCVDIMKKYIFNLDNTEAITEYHYCNNDNAIFDTCGLLKILKGLKTNHRETLESLIRNIQGKNIHATGHKIIEIYLKTIYNINEKIKTEKITSVPFYVRDSLKPIAPFFHVNNGLYAYTIKYFDDFYLKNIDGDSLSFDKVDDDGVHNYDIYYRDVERNSGKWCGKVTIAPENVDSFESTSDYYDKREFIDDSLKSTIDSFGPHALDALENMSKLVSAADKFIQDRYEHFTIFARYCVDFSNILKKLYAEQGMFDDKGDLNIEKLKLQGENAHYIKPDDESYPTNITATVESLMENIYSGVLTYTLPEKEEFPEKFKYIMDMNSKVVRDYSSDKKQLSKMIYFYDILGSNPEIYKNDIRENKKSVFGIFTELNNQKIGDILTEQLGKNKTFNDMVIKKCMMSQVLLKILEPNSINPYYSFLTGDEMINNEFEKLCETDVREMLVYINLDKYSAPVDRRITDNKEKYKVLFMNLVFLFVIYVFTYVILENTIKVNIMQDYGRANGRNKHHTFTQFFQDVEEIIKLKEKIELRMHLDDNLITDEIIEDCKKSVKYLKETIYTSIYNMMSLFMNENIPCTYRYNITSMLRKKDLLTLFLKEEIDVVKEKVKVYYENEEEFFPNHSPNIHSETDFLYEHLDIARKFRKIESYTGLIWTLQKTLNIIANLDTIDDIFSDSTDETKAEYQQNMTAMINLVRNAYNQHNINSLIYSYDFQWEKLIGRKKSIKKVIKLITQGYKSYINESNQIFYNYLLVTLCFRYILDADDDESQPAPETAPENNENL